MEKYFVVDTNIILNDAEDIFILSENGKNTIVLTETIIEELDKFKIGNDEINFQARKFNRILSEGKVLNKAPFTIDIRGTKLIICKNISKNEKPDLKIIETAIDFLKDKDFKFISNDILFRTFVLLKGFEAEPFFNNNKDIRTNFYQEYITDEVLPNKEYINCELLNSMNIEVKKYFSSIKITDANGKPFYFIRVDENNFKRLNDKNKINLFGIKPKNNEQEIFIEHCLNMNNDIITISASAGSGKTLLALVSAMKLKDQGKIDKIIYIRKTIISGDVQDELGFLPGELDEKMAGYVYPLKDNLEIIIKSKNKKKKQWSNEEIMDEIKKIEEQYNIEYLYAGHLRGRTLSEKTIVIWDEAQNDTKTGLKTLLSRIPETSRVIILGSLNQIDNPYLNKHNNALSYMLNSCGIFNDIIIQGCELNKVYRGRIANWIEKQKI
jgi:PhoH-like ATPase